MQASNVRWTLIKYTRCIAYSLNSASDVSLSLNFLGGGKADLQSLQKQILPSTNKVALKASAEKGQMIDTSNASRKSRSLHWSETPWSWFSYQYMPRVNILGQPISMGRLNSDQIWHTSNNKKSVNMAKEIYLYQDQGPLSSVATFITHLRSQSNIKPQWIFSPPRGDSYSQLSWLAYLLQWKHPKSPIQSMQSQPLHLTSFGILKRPFGMLSSTLQIWSKHREIHLPSSRPM